MMEAPKRATKFAANDEWGKVYRKGEHPLSCYRGRHVPGKTMMLIPSSFRAG